MLLLIPRRLVNPVLVLAKALHWMAKARLERKMSRSTRKLARTNKRAYRFVLDALLESLEGARPHTAVGLASFFVDLV